MDDTSIAGVHATILARLQRDLQLRPEAIEFEVRPTGQQGVYALRLDLRAGELPRASDRPSLLASARKIAQEEVDRTGHAFVFASD